MTIEFSTLINLGLGVLCLAVMVQCLRLDRNIKHLKSGALGKNVAAINTATDNARAVLGQLKHTLSTDGVACAAAVEKAKEASDELNVMIGIGGSMADRLVRAAEAAPKVAETPAAKPATKRKTTTAAKKKAPAKSKTAAKPKAAATRKKPATKTKTATKTATRKKAAPKTKAATAAGIKVPTPPINGQRTLRLVEKNETAEPSKIAKVA